MCALLRNGITEILYSGTLPKDAVSMINALTSIGAIVYLEDGKITVKSDRILNQNASVNLEECGTGYAFFKVLNRFPGWNLSVSCDGTLKNRDYSFADNVIVNNSEITVDASKSSQAVSGAIICSTFLQKKSDIVITGNVVSSGYIEMTAEVAELMSQSGTLTVEAEPDMTTASVFRAMNYLGANVKVRDCEKESLQPDAKAERIFREKGEIDLTDNPDLIFSVAVICASRYDNTTIKGVKRLKNKESDRASGACEMINSLGGTAFLKGDKLVVYGNGRLKGGRVNAKGDHRVLFGAFLASLISDGKIVVDSGDNAAEKSCPDFFELVKKLEVHENEN